MADLTDLPSQLLGKHDIVLHLNAAIDALHDVGLTKNLSEYQLQALQYSINWLKVFRNDVIERQPKKEENQIEVITNPFAPTRVVTSIKDDILFRATRPRIKKAK